MLNQSQKQKRSTHDRVFLRMLSRGRRAHDYIGCWRQVLQGRLARYQRRYEEKGARWNLQELGPELETSLLEVLSTDFLQDTVGKAVPYGIYDLAGMKTT